ncbi:MAG: tRNA pseudouridine38-40 synthase [Natronomonas sp.]|jgi:tRNA pseudouridine38-40 synthase|uniref:tRNA pseudouridine(38-40) synthase TruA n=1 Tax=Natronomonas sp. TaxID=2184060 RepID=UPI0039896F6D
MRAFQLAYDGTGYRGFQRQPHGETVEDTLFDALAALDVELVDGVPPGYAAAGRTDAGVSARAQTVAFEAPAWLTPRAFNGELPADIRAWAYDDADEFHATYDATERAYRYFRYGPGSELDADRAAAACEQLSGAHDFHNFTPDETGTERDLSASVERDEAFLVFEFRAGGFARQLVRRLVSAIVAVASDERDLSFLDRALADAPLTGGDGIAPAAPEPLVLLDVRYPGLDFTVDETAAASARAVFDRRRRERLAGARVAGTLVPDGDG